jgi:hypothetical protein
MSHKTLINEECLPLSTSSICSFSNKGAALKERRLEVKKLKSIPSHSSQWKVLVENHNEEDLRNTYKSESAPVPIASSITKFVWEIRLICFLHTTIDE